MSSTPQQTIYDALFSIDHPFTISDNGISFAKCPAHDDKWRSLKVTDGADAPLLQCLKGCSEDQILAALGLASADLEDAGPENVTTPAGNPIVEGQSAVAERVVQRNPGKFMYVPSVGWFVYDGKRWDQGNGVAEMQVEQAVIRAARSMLAEASKVADATMREKLFKLGHRTLSSSAQVAGAVDFVRLHPDVLTRADQLNADPMLFNVMNGTLDLSSGDLLLHDPKDRITRIAGTEYRPEARSKRWDQFLAEALGDGQLIAAVARCFGGMGLSGIVRDHSLPIIHGPGGTGKTTFIDTLATVFGDYAIAAEPELLLANRSGSSHPTGTMDLLGVRLAFVSETDDGRRMASATVKRLTGGDTIRARKMGKDFVQFKPSHLLALITNHLPTMPAGDDPAVWRRLRVIPFDHVPDQPDKRLGERLKNELPGVLTWLVEGFADFERNGDDAGWPQAVIDATSTYRSRSDLLGTFLDERTEKSADATAGISTGILYNEWKGWLEANAPDVKPGRTGDFVQKLKDRGETVSANVGKGARTTIRGRSLVYVSDVSDVSLIPLENTVFRKDESVKTSETSETLLSGARCASCSEKLSKARIYYNKTECESCEAKL